MVCMPDVHTPYWMQYKQILQAMSRLILHQLIPMKFHLDENLFEYSQ